MTMNDTWGWKKDDHNWKSVADLTHKLVDIASKGGNFLLNVGPTETGVIPGPSVERLGAMGRWMKANGASIYGTTQSPYRRHPFEGRCTVKGNTLYVHAFDWPAGGLRLTGLKSAPTSARLLDGGAAVRYRTEAGEEGTTTLVMERPSRTDPLDTVAVLTFTGAPQAASIVPKVQADASGVLILKAADAEIKGSTARLQGSGDDANIGYWTNAEDAVNWTVEVDRPGTYKVEVRYACEPGSEGSTYTVSAWPPGAGEGGVGRKIDNNNDLRATVASTGGWGAFKTERLGGSLRLERGKNRVAVGGVIKPGQAVMNLASVRLTPVK
jgi:alpha-L-fucosidase